jgi:hypothetical protein
LNTLSSRVVLVAAVAAVHWPVAVAAALAVFVPAPGFP